MIYDPTDPDCENEKTLRNATSILIVRACGKCWCKMKMLTIGQ
jgi:hypothetical protein